VSRTSYKQIVKLDFLIEFSGCVGFIGAVVKKVILAVWVESETF